MDICFFCLCFFPLLDYHEQSYYEMSHMSFCGLMPSLPLGRYLREFFLSYMVIVCFTLYKLASYFLKWLYHSAFPPAIYESYKSILLGAMVESCTESTHYVAHDTSAHITVKRASHVSRALVNKMGVILFSQQWKVPKEMD